MTTIDEATEAIYERWRVQWGSTTPYAFENESYNLVPTAGRVRVSVQPRPKVDATLGAPGFRRHTRYARILIQVFAPPDEGMRTINQLAHQAKGVFESTSFSGVRCKPCTMRTAADDGALKQIVIDVPFDYQETL